MFIERSYCPGCGGTNVQTELSVGFDDPRLGGFISTYYGIDPATLADAPYALDRCIACGLIYQKHVGDEWLLTELYSKWAPIAESAEEVPDFVNNTRAPAQSRDGHELMTAAAFLDQDIKDLRVLDYGMGWGLWPAIARSLGVDAYGMELSDKMIANARRHGVNVIEDIGDLRFDFINLEQVIEHVPNPQGLVAKLGQALKPRGVVKLSLPNASNAPNIIRLIKSGRFAGDYETIMPVQPLEHINSFTPGAVQHMASSVGMRIVRPSLRDSYAFLARGGMPRRMHSAAKELVRPVWQYHNYRNIYAWLTAA
jgi:2-polyprenyl-3-methyl-5-hydroxy-6-metoxy-1,4-benzoquinol methylase